MPGETDGRDRRHTIEYAVDEVIAARAFKHLVAFVGLLSLPLGVGLWFVAADAKDAREAVRRERESASAAITRERTAAALEIEAARVRLRDDMARVQAEARQYVGEARAQARQAAEDADGASAVFRGSARQLDLAVAARVGAIEAADSARDETRRAIAATHDLTAMRAALRARVDTMAQLICPIRTRVLGSDVVFVRQFRGTPGGPPDRPPWTLATGTPIGLAVGDVESDGVRDLNVYGLTGPRAGEPLLRRAALPLDSSVTVRVGHETLVVTLQETWHKEGRDKALFQWQRLDAGSPGAPAGGGPAADRPCGA